MDLGVKHVGLDPLLVPEHHHPHPVLAEVGTVVALRVEEVVHPTLLNTGGREGGREGGRKGGMRGGREGGREGGRGEKVRDNRLQLQFTCTYT